MKCWARLFIGDPDFVLVDHGSVFTARHFKNECDKRKIVIRFTRKESPSSLGTSESYHAPLRRVYLKLRKSHPGIPREVSLQQAVYAINTLSGPNGIMSARLVFGSLPRHHDIPGTSTVNSLGRCKTMQTAHEEYQKFVA